MDESENLPVKFVSKNNLTTKEGKCSSLVGRGLAALRRNHDELYRQAREVYNRLTDDGLGMWSGFKERELPLSDVLESFKQLAAVHYGKAYFPLSTLYSGWQSLEGDPAQAELYRKLSFGWLYANQNLNDPEIWHDLGAHYVGNDADHAIQWFQKAADAGDAGSMWGLVGAYEHLENWGEALYWQIKAAEAGHEEAQHGLESQNDHGDLDIYDEQVFNWYVWSAEQGHVWAELFLAEASCRGTGVDQDYEQAVYWYRMAAEQGNVEGQWLLGGMYEYGRGVIPDIDQAKFWYRKAAEQGSEKAQLSLDEMYDEGHGGVLDEEQATYWNIESAEKGHVWAMRNLGLMYHNGLRVEQDDARAAYWFRKAAHLGDAESRQIQLNLLKEKLMKLSPEGQQRVLKAAKARMELNEYKAQIKRKT